MQEVTREIAFGHGWSSDRKDRIAQLFDALAPEWHTRGGEQRLLPTRDALERGSVPEGGVAVEIGSGTGIQTAALVERFSYVVSVDLSAEMLARSPRRDTVSLARGDAAALPLAGASVDAVVCVNAYLFPEEYARVLRPAGCIVFVSTSGPQTPIYLPPDDVVAASQAAFGPVRGVTSTCEWGVWTVVSRDP